MAVDIAQEFTDLVASSQAVEKQRQEKLRDLSVQITQLYQEHLDVTRDLSRERIIARATQEEIETWQHRFEDLQKSVDSSSFVLVLVDADGDGYTFQDEYYQNVDGGRMAALRFRELVRKYIEERHPNMSSLPIVVKAFANEDGLSKLLVNANIIKPPLSLKDFAKGFSQAHGTCDFVLVGSGKDRADVKIKGFFEQFIKNPTCRHIIFGACHDNGYVRMLEEYDQSVLASRVTLLQPFDLGREFSSLKLPCMQMKEIFRTQRVANHQSPSPTRRQLPEESTKSVDGLTWATHLSVIGDTNSVNVSRKFEDLPAGAVFLNSANQRIDAHLREPNRRAVESWRHKTRKANMRYCHAYQLHPGVCDKDDCCYSHGPLSDEEKLVFRHERRLERCYTGLQCKDPDCLYGHNCACTNQHCKFFREMHNVDFTKIHVSGG